jgi:PAS domain S-box-containing protein
MRLDEARRCFRFEKEDLAYALRLRISVWLGAVLRASSAVLAAAAIAGALTEMSSVWWIYGAFAIVLLGSLVLDGMKRTREAGVVLSLGFWGAATLAVVVLGGARSPGVFVYLPIVLTAGLFWSWRAAAGLAAASLAVVTLAAWLDEIHRLPLPLRALSSAGHLPIFAGSLTMTVFLVGIALHTMHGVLRDAQRSLLRTEDLLLHVPDALAVFDRLGIVLAVSSAMAERMGYAATDLIGKHISHIDLFNRDSHTVSDDLRWLGVRGGEGGRELPLTRRDGSPAWGEARMHAIPIGTGDSLRRIVLYDVTRRHLAEARQADLEERMQRSRRLESMGLLAGGVAHDFNNLLTVILSLGTVLDREISKDSPARELLTDFRESAVRAAALARNLIAPPAPPVPHAVDVGRTLTAFEPVLARMVDGEDIDLTVRVPERPCWVSMDRGCLERIVMNLVVNARDAMPNGGSIVVAVAASHEGDGPLPMPRMVEISVSDTGVGMDPALQPRIFEPFFTTKGASGTGLGLATVDDMVTRLGGCILVDSQPGRGTKIRILLPHAATDDLSS